VSGGDTCIILFVKRAIANSRLSFDTFDCITLTHLFCIAIVVIVAAHNNQRNLSSAHKSPASQPHCFSSFFPFIRTKALLPSLIE
jgi:hypothetical protein